jgi:hypothetical protein
MPVTSGMNSYGENMTSTVNELFTPHPFLHGFMDTFPWHIDPSANPYYSPLYYLLCRIVEAKNILEIGLDAGYSSYMLGVAARENDGMFFGIEKHEGKAKRIKAAMDEREIPNTIILADSNDIEKWEWSDRIDFALLDGNHNPRTIMHEVEILYPVLPPGGLFCIHDVWSWAAEGWLEVKQHFDFADNFMLIHNYGIGILRKAYGNEAEKHLQLVNAFQKWQADDWEAIQRTRTGEVIVL